MKRRNNNLNKTKGDKVSEELKRGIYHIQVIDINIDIMGDETIEFKILDLGESDKIYKMQLGNYYIKE